MSLFQDFPSLLMCFHHIRQQFKLLSDTVLVQAAMLSTSCSSSDSDTCRDDTEALSLKLIAIGSILVAGVTGVCIPLVGKRSRHLSNDSHLFVATKAFAAGVILATGFVHMLPDGSENLTSSCLPTHPWSDFPFAGCIAMCSALVTLMADFVGTQIYESKAAKVKEAPAMDVPVLETVHIVGAYAHADHHVHRPGDEDGDEDEDEDKGGHSHLPRFGGGDGESSGRHAVVSQVLELGILSHSVIIGLSIGVSHSPCTIRPLVAALSFHQFFEGFALGGCISEANFKPLKMVLMASFFAITTPSGIAAGIGLASFYDADSSGALIVEGILDSISAGILIYMSLVDLIAADFMSTKMRCNLRLQIASYAALFLGAALMSSLAVWS